MSDALGYLSLTSDSSTVFSHCVPHFASLLCDRGTSESDHTLSSGLSPRDTRPRRREFDVEAAKNVSDFATHHPYPTRPPPPLTPSWYSALQTSDRNDQLRSEPVLPTDPCLQCRHVREGPGAAQGGDGARSHGHRRQPAHPFCL
jgi:hypothetical protein